MILKTFFSWDSNVKYDAIIGNPPYVNGKLIDNETINIIENDKNLTLPITSNLYLHVIEKCVKHYLKSGGELVFIIPDTIMSKSSKGSRLRSWMCDNGCFTHFLKTDVKWEKASVSTCIIRWVKDKKQKKIITESGDKNIFHSDGMIYILDYKPKNIFSSFFKIGVGSAPSKKLLLKKDLGGIGFIGGKEIKYYDASDMNSWPRKRITAKKHKILFLAGPTRKENPFYTTVSFGSTDQSSMHLDSFMMPKFDFKKEELDDIVEKLNEFFNRRNHDLKCRVKGRWSIGIKELSNMPTDYDLNYFLTMF